MNKKKSVSKNILLAFSISFVTLFLIMLVFSICVTVLPHCNNISKGIISFFGKFSEFEAISDPFGLFIEILTSIGGVFFGIRIGQWIDDKEEKEKLSELWKKTNSFLKRLKSDINNNEVSIYELAEYKIYWDSLQRADNIATRFLQGDERYIDISFVFSFLTFYIYSWSKYNSIDQWKANSSTIEAKRIQNWIDSFDDLILYTEEKSSY